jgi:Lrp/AsnC family transcriptional regulator, regulator for asnA, asnC and gidA
LAQIGHTRKCFRLIYIETFKNRITESENSMLPTGSLTETDRGILGELLVNARKGFADIAKDLKISKNTVRNRYEEMEREGIIVGSTVQVNYRNLGYDCVAAILLNVDASQVDNISKQIAEIPDVFGPFISSSRYNIRAVFALKTIFELESIKESLRRKIAVVEVSSNIWNDVWFLPGNLSLIYKSPAIFEKFKLDKPTRCSFDADDIDLKLIRKLSLGSRISFRKMASEIGISTETTIRRFEKLENSGTIVPRIQINPVKIGYQALTHFLLRVSSQNDSTPIIEQIIQIPDVVYIMKTVGDFQIGIMLMVKNPEKIIETGQVISKISGVKSVETSIQRIENKWPIPRTYTST